MRVFISYSHPDLGMVRQVATYLANQVEVLYWDKDKQPGERSWAMIHGWIDAADVVMPDPDLIIRTAGERRLSNFLPWQGVYSEILFWPQEWPEAKRILRALKWGEYSLSLRREGARLMVS